MDDFTDEEIAALIDIVDAELDWFGDEMVEVLLRVKTKLEALQLARANRLRTQADT